MPLITEQQLIKPINKEPQIDWSTATTDRMSQIKKTWEDVNLQTDLNKSITYHTSIILTSKGN